MTFSGWNLPSNNKICKLLEFASNLKPEKVPCLYIGQFQLYLGNKPFRGGWNENIEKVCSVKILTNFKMYVVVVIWFLFF
jgi:hypothetical protein